MGVDEARSRLPSSTPTVVNVVIPLKELIAVHQSTQDMSNPIFVSPSNTGRGQQLR